MNSRVCELPLIPIQGFDRGVHEWRVTIVRTPCCGYVGVIRAIEDPNNHGDQSRFHDKDTHVGVKNLSGDRNINGEVGSVKFLHVMKGARSNRAFSSAAL